MPRYLWQVNYTADGARGLLTDGGTSRRDAIVRMVESVGGTVDSVHFALGGHDLYVLGEVPDELRQIRRELKFDYGKFDYTMVDGRPVLFDANRTPTIGRFPKARYLPLAETLAGGLDSFLQTSPG